MSEEEIIRELKLFIVSIKSDLEDDSNEDNFNTMRAIEGLLDLYNKEKEKNKELKEENSFLKKIYSGTEEFKAIEKFANKNY